MRAVFDFLGCQIMIAIGFWKSNFHLEECFEDVITNQASVAAQVLFEEVDGKWVLRADSIPGNIFVKAIAVNQECLFLEMGLLDESRLKTVFVDRSLPFTLTTAGLKSTRTEKIVARVKNVPQIKHEEVKLLPRALWEIPLDRKDNYSLMEIVSLIDLLYTENCFREDDPEESSGGDSTATGIGMTMSLNMSLMTQLRMEQRPILLLQQEQKQQQEQKVEMRTEQKQTQLQVLFCLQTRLLKMSHEELVAFASEYAAINGEQAWMNLAYFTLARRIRKAAESGGKSVPSWKNAREIARKLCTQPR